MDEDVAAKFDEILQRASTPPNGITAASEPAGRKVLALRQPERRILPAVNRRLDLVDAGLLDVFRRLVAGKARWPLYLHGPAGVGKTWATLAFCDVAATAAYWTVEDLCDFVMRETPAEVEGEFQRIADKDLVVLDELGERENVGDLHSSVVKKFSDARELHANRVAIYASNLNPKELAGLYDDRILSRALCGTHHKLEGEDRRFQS